MATELSQETKQQIDETLKIVTEALTEKGYNAAAQICGYLLTDDPTYITFHKNARQLITQLDRDVIQKHVVKTYLKTL